MSLTGTGFATVHRGVWGSGFVHGVGWNYDTITGKWLKKGWRPTLYSAGIKTLGWQSKMTRLSTPPWTGHSPHTSSRILRHVKTPAHQLARIRDAHRGPHEPCCPTRATIQYGLISRQTPDGSTSEMASHIHCLRYWCTHQ